MCEPNCAPCVGRTLLFYSALIRLSVAAEDTCPARWTVRENYCIWPFQKQYKNLSVASASDEGAACCAACAADTQCKEWLVHKTNPNPQSKRSVPAGMCILNNAIVQGQAPNQTNLGCISGLRPPPPTPAPAPAPANAKNILFFAVDGLIKRQNILGDRNTCFLQI